MNLISHTVLRIENLMDETRLIINRMYLTTLAEDAAERSDWLLRGRASVAGRAVKLPNC